MTSEDALMESIARRTIDDAAVADALMPGAAGSVTRAIARPLPARDKVSIMGLTAGVAFRLADCCHPVPGDRIVGLRRPDAAVEVHAIDCPTLALPAPDADWVDLAWDDASDGGTARLAVILRNEPGALGAMASIFGAHAANILNLRLVHRDASFHTFQVDLEVQDVGHMMRILAALRAADAISSAERLRLGEEEALGGGLACALAYIPRAVRAERSRSTGLLRRVREDGPSTSLRANGRIYRFGLEPDPFCKVAVFRDRAYSSIGRASLTASIGIVP